MRHVLVSRGFKCYDGVKLIGIDETSFLHGHKYITVVVDLERKEGSFLFCVENIF
jgi:transposase